MTVTGLRNTVVAAVILVAALTAYDAVGGGKPDTEPDPDERKVEIRYFGPSRDGRKPPRFNTAGHIGKTPFQRANKGHGYVESGTAKVGDEVYSHMWYVEGSSRDYIRCEVWQGTTNITESIARADVHRDYTCWAQVKP